MGCGVGLIALGFVFLSFTDPLGRNAFCVLSPLSILAGYALVFLGIFWPLEGEAPALSSSPSSPPAQP